MASPLKMVRLYDVGSGGGVDAVREGALFGVDAVFDRNDLGERARSSFKSVLSRVESALATSPSGDFFLGDEVSLVDLLFAPFFERTVASLPFFKGFLIRAAPGAATNPYPSLQILAFMPLGYTVVYPRVLSWFTSRPVH